MPFASSRVLTPERLFCSSPAARSGLWWTIAAQPATHETAHVIGMLLEEVAPRDEDVGDQVGRLLRRGQDVTARPLAGGDVHVGGPAHGGVDLVGLEHVGGVHGGIGELPVHVAV